MQFGRIWILRGPNIWARTPVIEAELDLGKQAAEKPAATSIATLGLPPASTYAELLLHLTRYLQEQVGHLGPIAQVHATRKAGHFRVVFDHDGEPLASACLQEAFGLISAMRAGTAFDV